MPAPRATTSSTDSASRSWRQTALAVVLIVVAGLAAYHNSLRGPFIFDDLPAIPENPTLRDLRSLRDVLSPPGGGETVTGRPLLNLTFALNYAAGGVEVRGYHAVNLALHLCAGLVLFGLLRVTLARPAVPAWLRARAHPLALGSALLWIAHPLNTESVTYIAQRAELLAGLFYLLTLFAFACGVDSPRPRRWLTAAVAACLLGMAAKEVLATAPLMVWLYDRTFVAGGFGRALRARPRFYAALVATWLPLGWLVLRAGARGGTATWAPGLTTWHYALTQCEAVATYLRLALWPHPLVLDYGVEEASSLFAVWPQAALLLGLAAATVVALVRRPLVGFVGAGGFVLLAPSSSFVAITTQTIAEHRMYLPLAGLVAAVAIAGWLVMGRRIAWAIAVGALATAGLTVARNHDYRSAVAIWGDTRAKRPLNPRAHAEYALALFRDGRAAAALAPYAEALRLRPDYAAAHHNLASALWQLGRFDEAVAHYEEAARLNPDFAETHVMLGNALAALKRWPEAVGRYETAVRLKPHLVEARVRLANALMVTNRPAEAIPHYEFALRAGATDPSLHNNLGVALLRCARPDEAIAQFETALRLEPGNAEAAANLARATATPRPPATIAPPSPR